ncbi:MAG: ABC transporter substrate-binding protein [Proteobacteria bacterium]|nr:ABC transporter substrate-binding protein [Pseudomonadota bacterium]
MKSFLKKTLLASGMLLLATSALQAKGRLTIYCSMQPYWCQAAADTFAKKFNVRVAMTRSGSGSTYAKVLAEKNNPKGDIWYGGTLDPHSQAGVKGLLYSYKSPLLKDLGLRFRNPAASQKNHTVGIYAGVLGYSVNTELLKSYGLPMPESWMDLVKPIYKGHVQVASPQSSGTAYTELATITQLWGEEKAFAYLADLHQNIGQYTKSGSAPGKSAARGETLIGIGFLHDHAKQVASGFPLEMIVPSEGTGFEIGGLSIIKNARNLDNAKLFVDWALSKEGQEVGGSVQAFQVPTNMYAKVPKEAIRLEAVKLIDYNFVKYGSDEMRSHLIDRWAREIKSVQR